MIISIIVIILMSIIIIEKLVNNKYKENSYGLIIDLIILFSLIVMAIFKY
jgi:hypothetical protein